MELPTNFEYFEKGSSKIEKLIKEQGDVVCREKIGRDYIKNITDKYLFGFVHKTPIAQIGQRRKKTNNEYLYSFILCDILEAYNSINIHLICSRVNARDGRKLIELACKKAIELGYESLTLHSILDDKLVKWYKSQGFKISSEIFYPISGDLKCYLMTKELVE